MREGFFSLRPSGQRKAKNCKASKPCRNSCISTAYACVADLSPEQKKLAIKARKAMKAGKIGDAVEIPIPTPDNSAADKAKIDSSLHDFYDSVKSGQGLSKQDEDAVLVALGLDGSDGQGLAPWKQTKADKLQKDQLTYVESVAFEGYIGGDYRGMNEVLYNAKGFQNGEENRNGLTFEEQIVVNKAAASGLAKLPPVTEDQIAEFNFQKGYKPGDPMLRHETLSGDVLAQHIEKHKAAAQSGEPVIKEQFFSTTFSQEGVGYFSEGANIEYKIKAKTDGTGEGRLVDKYKNQAFEAEVLYPPMSGFRVTSVEELPGKAAITGIKEIEVPATNIGKAQEVAVKQISDAEWMSSLSGSGFNKTVIAAKMNSKAKVLEIMAKNPVISNSQESKDLMAQSKALQKIASDIKSKKGSKKSDLKKFKSDLEDKLVKGKKTTIEKVVEISPATEERYIIEMEEI